jgi:hypothetical protein
MPARGKNPHRHRGRLLARASEAPLPQGRCRIGTIRQTLGYAPQQTFEHTLGELIQLARSGDTARAE